MDPRKEQRIFSVAGLGLAGITCLFVYGFGWSTGFAFVVPVFGGLAFLIAFESFQHGTGARVRRALHERRSHAG